MAIFPNSASAGLTFDRAVTLTAYSPPDWQLSAVLRGAGTINMTSVADGNLHRFRVESAQTAAWAPGSYWYSIRATDGTSTVEIEHGEIVIKPDLSSENAGFDGRVHVQRMLEAIEAVLEKRATLDQERYKINNRELWRTPINELLMLRDRYRSELRRMKAVAGGSLFDSAVRIRFRGAS